MFFTRKLLVLAPFFGRFWRSWNGLSRGVVRETWLFADRLLFSLVRNQPGTRDAGRKTGSWLYAGGGKGPRRGDDGTYVYRYPHAFYSMASLTFISAPHTKRVGVFSRGREIERKVIAARARGTTQ